MRGLMMKKVILLAGCIGLIASCGVKDEGIGAPLGKTAIKDKNGVVVGYVAENTVTDATMSESFDTYDFLMQDINSNLVRLNLASGKLARIGVGGGYYGHDNYPLYFETENCGGAVYTYNTQIGFLGKTYPFMTDSAKSAVDNTISEKAYELTSIAVGTEKVKSYLVLDYVYNLDTNRFNAEDSDTNKYKCVSFADVAPTDGWGQCIETTGAITCSDTIQEDSYLSYNNCVDDCSTGTFTPYNTIKTSLPLTMATYSRDWGVLTEVAAQDITDKKAIVDYSDVAPLTIATF